MKKLLVVSALTLLVAALLGSCGRAPTAPGKTGAANNVRHLPLPTIVVYPDGGEGGGYDSPQTGVFTNSVDSSTTVQVVDRNDNTYFLWSYIIYQPQFYYQTRARSVGDLVGLEAIGAISDTSTIWTMADSIAYVYQPIDLNGATPYDAASAAATNPPPPPPPVEVPPIQLDNIPPTIRKTTWGELKNRWR
jgi:hypothetical protein